MNYSVFLTIPLKHVILKTFCFLSNSEHMTSQTCLHSEKYDSLSLSDSKEVVSVSCYKQEELLVVLASNNSNSHVVLTKQRMHLCFGFQETHEQN